MDTKFNMEEIEKTITNYSKRQLTQGIVISVKENGLIFNLGGKLDAFIPKDEVEEFESFKIGDRFSVVILGGRSEDGLILASQRKAAQIEFEGQSAREIKLGCAFSCIISSVTDSGALISKMGDYEITIPEDDICSYRKVNPKTFLNRKVEAIATEIYSDEKKIKASIKILEDKTKEESEQVFWRTNFINKIVEGTVKRFVPYGAFVDVGGVSCLLHISNISYSRINSPSEVLEIGKKYKFKILQMDRDNKKVSLGFKQLQGR